MLKSAPSLLLAILFALTCWSGSVQADPAAEARKILADALANEDVDQQIALIRKLDNTVDPFVQQTLAAWRESGVYIFESPDGKKIPFVLDANVDANGKAKGIQILTHDALKGPDGQPMLFAATDLTAVDTNSKLRKAIKTALDLFSLYNPDPNLRRDAAAKLGLEQNADYLPYFAAQAEKETDPRVKKALKEALATTQLVDEKPEVRVAAAKQLGEMRSISTIEILKKMLADAQANPKSQSPEFINTARASITKIENYIFMGDLVGTFFRGLSLSTVLLIAALGLAITFGLMGIINMAHGEMIMVGAYSAYVMQNLFIKWFGASGLGFNCYFIAAIPFSFFTAACVGLILERGIIRYLYKRPLESLLATWGVSLVLQQVFRSTFGAANVQVSSPTWLSGSFVVNDVLFAYNRIFVIGFAVFIVFLTYLLLTKTSAGLQIRAVMQNRNMAACMGVRTDRVNMITFAFGSGLAGVAGACLSQIGNVGPSLGQSHILDCFMVVVLGGVGNLIGTIMAALGIGVTDQILQPFLGAVLGKITVLAAIILFLQWRPSGLFVTRSRSLEG